METTVLLRKILYHAMMSNDADEIIRSIKVMCTKDDIASVEQMLAEARAAQAKKTKEN